VRLNTPLEPDEVQAFGADAVVLATGSLPAETGFQRDLAQFETLPGIERGKVWSVEDVMSRAAQLGERVVLLDDLGHWHGGGTAWHLAEHGHKVTIVTRYAMAAAELARTTADFPLRQKFKQLGVQVFTESAVAEWHGDGATVIDLRDRSESRVAADALVLATTNVANSWLADELAGRGLEIHQVGDCVAARHANMATYEGRKVGLAL